MPASSTLSSTQRRTAHTSPSYERRRGQRRRLDGAAKERKWRLRRRRSGKMSSPYLSLTAADREAMLEAIGVSSVEELFREIPEAVRFRRELALEPQLGEAELTRHLEELAAKN